MISLKDNGQFRDGFPTVDPEADSKCKDYALCAIAYNLLKSHKKVQESSILATRVQLWGIDLANKCDAEDCSKRAILTSPNRSAVYLVNEILAGEI